MKAKGLILGALLAMTVTASATVIDNGQFGPNIGSVGGAYGSDIYGQSFIAPADNVLVKFGMWLQGGDATGPKVSIDLWADDGSNHPDETKVLVSGTVWSGYLADLTRIDTTTSYALVPGQRYWIVINGMIDQQNQFSYNSTWDGGTNTIKDGNMDWSNDMGATWSGGIPNGDWGVYIETVPEPTTLALLALAALMLRRR